MMEISGVQSAPALPESSSGGVGSLSPDDFIKILVTELSNQSPLEPIDNKQLLDQINAINSVNSNQQLVEALTALSTNQGLGSASGLIGRNVTGLFRDQVISGVVEKAIVEDGKVFVVVDGVPLTVDSITEIS